MGNFKHLMYRMELSDEHSLALVDGVYAPQTKDITFIIDDYMQEWKNICNKYGKKNDGLDEDVEYELLCIVKEDATFEVFLHVDGENGENYSEPIPLSEVADKANIIRNLIGNEEEWKEKLTNFLKEYNNDYNKSKSHLEKE